jgi:hypothetical protein
MNYKYQLSTLFLFFCVALAFSTQQSCRKSADVVSPINLETKFQLEKVIGTYAATDTFISLTNMSPITFDTVYSTFDIVVSAKGTKMIQFDTVLDDNYILSNQCYCLDDACTCYKYLTDVSFVSYDNTFYNSYQVNVVFEGNKLKYTTNNSKEKQLRMGVAFKK